jgi:hypothetical protein
MLFSKYAKKLDENSTLATYLICTSSVIHMEFEYHFILALHLCLRDIGYRDIESMLATHSECQTIA